MNDKKSTTVSDNLCWEGIGEKLNEDFFELIYNIASLVFLYHK